MAKNIDLKSVRKTLFSLLKPDRHFFTAAIVYGVAIGLLTLAVPLAVQTLINSVVNTASVQAVITLAVVLFIILLVSGIFSALRMRVMEYYERKVYSRLTSQLSLKTIFAPHRFFEGRRNVAITQRYFDIMTLQKNIPSLMIDGFALVLQMLVGFTLVSFYHPAFFAFNILILLVMLGIWKIWGKGAKRSAVRLSQAKYDGAKWLSDIAAAHEFFKSSRHLDYAAGNTQKHIEGYLSAHRQHFRFTFTQAVMFLLLYAAASASLLGIGGYLVVQGQLSLGQLVAAELIMSAVFLGISRFSIYLKLYYELYGAAEKLGGALKMPQEDADQTQQALPASSALRFDHVKLKHTHHNYSLTWSVPAGQKCFVMTKHAWMQKQLVSFIKRHENAPRGVIFLGEKALQDYDIFELRQCISTIDRALMVECTVKEYFKMAAPDAGSGEVYDALRQVHLYETIEELPDGLDTTLSVMGNPLQPVELLLLKLAATILTKPSIVLVNQHFDAIPAATRLHLLKVLENINATVLYFTNAPNDRFFDQTVTLEDLASSGVHVADGEPHAS